MNINVNIDMKEDDNTMIKTKNYIVNLDYDKRIKEHSFLIDTLNKYEANVLTGSILYIDNYTRKMKWFLSFDENTEFDRDEFIKWLSYRGKKIDKTYQKRMEENSAYFLEQRWNVAGLNTEEDVKLFVTRMPNGLFLYPAE